MLYKFYASTDVYFIKEQELVLQVLSTLNVLNMCLVSSWCVCAMKVLGRWKGQK